MLSRSFATNAVGCQGIKLSTSSSLSSPLSTQLRFASSSLLQPLAKLGSSRDLAEDVRNNRNRNNKEIVASFEKLQRFDEINYRKTDRPWEIVPKYVKKRVTDMVGVLQSEHRMEMEQIIDKMLPICGVDFYVVIVPTVGYVTTTAFANSIMFDWQIGEPKGNGLLLVICQHEGTVHLCASPAIERYFSDEFLNLAIQEIFQPLVREGKPSYATVMLTYAIATHAHEVRDLWKNQIIPLPVRNKIFFTAKVAGYGVFHQTPYVVGAIIFALLTAILWVQVSDMKCPECGTFMQKVKDPALMESIMPRGQWLEHKNGCAHYRVWKCGQCRVGERVVLMSRDLHQNNKCLKCVDCGCYTCSLTKSIERLPTKHEDGLKKLLYECEHCRVGREIMLPLYRPIDTKPENEWYGFLLEGSQDPKKGMNEKAKPLIKL